MHYNQLCIILWIKIDQLIVENVLSGTIHNSNARTTNCKGCSTAVQDNVILLGSLAVGGSACPVQHLTADFDMLQHDGEEVSGTLTNQDIRFKCRFLYMYKSHPQVLYSVGLMLWKRVGTILVPPFFPQHTLYSGGKNTLFTKTI